MWTLIFPIEDDDILLKEYGRAIIIITNVEERLKYIIQKGDKTTKGIDKKMLGKLIQLAQKFLAQDLIDELNKLNDKRITIIHGVVGSDDTTHFILKDGKEFPLDVNYLPFI